MEFVIISNKNNQTITAKKGFMLNTLSLFLHRNCQQVALNFVSAIEIDCTDLISIAFDAPCLDVGVWQLEITDSALSKGYRCIVNSQ